MQHGTKTQLVIATSLIVVSTSSLAYQEEYFLRTAFGISSLSNKDGDTTSIGNTNGKADVEPGNGFNAGLGLATTILIRSLLSFFGNIAAVKAKQLSLMAPSSLRVTMRQIEFIH